MTEFSSNIHDIYKSRNNLLSQLTTAGYNTQAFINFNQDEIFFMNVHKELNFQVSSDNGSVVYVKYFLDKSVKPKTIQDLTNEIFNDEFHPDNSTIVLITRDDPNATLMELIKQIFAEEHIYIIIYNIKRLLFNILDHDLVPKHIILSSQEYSNFISNFMIESTNQIPTISRFDPVAIAIFMRPNQICKIMRGSINAIHSTYFRRCVNT